MKQSEKVEYEIGNIPELAQIMHDSWINGELSLCLTVSSEIENTIEMMRAEFEWRG